MRSSANQCRAFGRTCVGAVAVLALAVGTSARDETPPDPPSVYASEVTRCQQLLNSPVPELRLEGIEGLRWLRHWQSESHILALVNDPDPLVRREAVQALTHLGTSRSVPALLDSLSDPSEHVSQLAWIGLQRMTAQSFPRRPAHVWTAWWQGSTREEKILELSQRLDEPAVRGSVLVALRHLAEPADEVAFLALVHAPREPRFSGDELQLCVEVLERIGSEASLPHLAPVPHWPGAAYALGRIGGPKAEAALLKAHKTPAVWVNLDRLRSRECAPFAARLLQSFGLISYRTVPDDVHRPPTPVQRVAANLLIRTGQASTYVDLLLCELEGESKAAEAPPALKAMLEGMRPELRPGFRRADGVAMSRALAALPHLVGAVPECASRFVPLLEHPAVVPRIYAALSLGRLRAVDAIPAVLKQIDAPYPFSDATAPASGKHFGHSQTVRWKGFFCMALGRVGGERARRELEVRAADAARPRDVRFGAVVGLGFLGSPASLPILDQVAEKDIIFQIRRQAAEAAREIRLRDAGRAGR